MIIFLFFLAAVRVAARACEQPTPPPPDPRCHHRGVPRLIYSIAKCTTNMICHVIIHYITTDGIYEIFINPDHPEPSLDG